jgi:hypothetical protein
MATAARLRHDLSLASNAGWCGDAVGVFYLLQLRSAGSVTRVRYEVWKCVVRKAILEYQQQQEKAPEETQTAIGCAAADETAFEQDVLVLMDLSRVVDLGRVTGGESTIRNLVGQSTTGITPMGVRVRALVSDRAH